MDNKEQEESIQNCEFDNDNFQNDYKILSLKLKSISDSIDLLEKNFLDKEK